MQNRMQNSQSRPNSNPPRRGPGRMALPVEKPKNLFLISKKLMHYIAYNKKKIFFLLFIMLIVTAIGLIIPVIQSQVINNFAHIIDPDYTERSNLELWQACLILIGVMAGMYLFNALCTYVQTRIAFRVSQDTVFKLRSDLFAKFVKLPIKFIDTHSHGDLMSRMTNDVENISNTISQSIASLISGALTIVGTLAIMIYYSWFLTLVTLVVVILTIFITALLTKKMRHYYKKQAKLLGKLNGHVEESVTGYRTIVAYNKEEDSEEEFNSISEELTKVSIVGQIWSGSMGPLMNCISNIGYVLIAFVGAWMALVHPWGLAMEIGTISLFLTSSRQFTRPISEIANLYGQILTAMTGAERVFEVLEQDDEIDKGEQIISEDEFEGNIEFNHIDFSYVEGEQVLTDFNLKVKKGQKIALVGATGSGKTTVVNLLMRFYDVDKGEILIDGVNINDIKKQSLRETIAIVLQDTVLFKDSIGTNIKYGNLDASFEEMKAASKFANVNYFVSKMQDKYDTMLSEGGTNLSQGQRQLISIARAVLANPKILILDEATSSVDTRTEKNIQDAMQNLMHNRTSLIIAHRLSTIQDADVIVVMDKGRIVEKGNHNELLNEKGKYFDLYMTQFAGKEI